MDNDVNGLFLARVNRVSLDAPNSEARNKLKDMCDSRNDTEIVKYFEANKSAADLTDLFHFVVLQLTCNNDPESLAKVLDLGRGREVKLGVQWKNEEDVISNLSLSGNPIMVASQWVCFKLW